MSIAKNTPSAIENFLSRPPTADQVSQKSIEEDARLPNVLYHTIKELADRLEALEERLDKADEREEERIRHEFYDCDICGEPVAIGVAIGGFSSCEACQDITPDGLSRRIEALELSRDTDRVLLNSNVAIRTVDQDHVDILEERLEVLETRASFNEEKAKEFLNNMVQDNLIAKTDVFDKPNPLGVGGKGVSVEMPWSVSNQGRAQKGK